MTDHIEKPKEKICLLVFNVSLNVGEIQEKLYGYRNPKVSSWIGELEEKGWIVKTSFPKFEKGKKKDRRQRYYTATSKCIIDNIELNISLKKSEKEKLKNLFESNDFKKLIGSFPISKTDFSIINQYIAFLSIVVNSFNIYTKNNLKLNSKDYKKYYNNIRKNVSKKEIADLIKNHMKLYSNFNIENSSFSDNFFFNFIDLGHNLLEKLASLLPNHELVAYVIFLTFSFNEAVKKYPKKDRK